LPRVYLDHSATTPVRAEVAQLVMEYFTTKYGNPSTAYFLGREAKKGMEKAREQVATLINAQPEEIIFTSGGTEADNLAITGIAYAYAEQGKHLITSAIEHQAVLASYKSLERHGYKITVLPVDKYGLVRIDDVKRAIRKDTILISIMHVNNEVGTIQPVEEIGAIARERQIVFHTDAVQSVGKIPVDVEKIQADLLTGSGHKFYGPKGSGFLFLSKGVKLAPNVFGGGQEKAYRPGTENVPSIVGMGLAAELAGKELKTEIPRVAALRDKLVRGLQQRIPQVRVNGDMEKRVCNNANLCFPGVEGEALLERLDLKGICVSSGSACSTGALQPSHVLLAMGLSPELAKSSLRITLGIENTEEEIDYVIEQLSQIYNSLVTQG
jgi:cysteine desulfurase